MNLSKYWAIVSIALAPWLAPTTPLVQVEGDVGRGNRAYLLSQRVLCFGLFVAEGLGRFLVRMAILGFLGFGIRFVLSGGLVGGAGLSILCGLFTAFVAATLNVLFTAMLGLSALFSEDTSPVYWLWQKLGFAFDGLMVPTPFPSLLDAPGRLTLGTNSGFVLVAWLTVALLSTHLTCRHALKSVRRNDS